MCFPVQGPRWKIDNLYDQMPELDTNDADSELNLEPVDQEFILSESAEKLLNLSVLDEFECPTRLPPDGNFDAWSETILGCEYQEQRRNKRPRLQPDVMLVQQEKEKIGTSHSSTGPFSSLPIATMTNIPEIKKPDFIFHPDNYFKTNSLEKQPHLFRDARRNTQENMKNASDEKEFEGKKGKRRKPCQAKSSADEEHCAWHNQRDFKHPFNCRSINRSAAAVQ
ncbi:WD repeat-containing protein 49 [Cichlidogyrus casuarinus]|uniref:WD repeat-containing protein 49 n=1 Tax=Cichlidogyrus casuarinus TaxID=1844966 RepID=A0ABD2Q6W3_9PLAT